MSSSHRGNHPQTESTADETREPPLGEGGSGISETLGDTRTPTKGIVGIEGEFPPWVPEGVYEFYLSHWETKLLFGKEPKAYLWFYVASGEYQGLLLPRYYNATKLISKPGEGGRFSVGPRSHFRKEYLACFGLGEIDLSRYTDCLVLGEVQTVHQDWLQQPKPEGLRESKIARILSLAKRMKEIA